MGQVQKKMGRTKETKFVGLCKLSMVARRPGVAESRLELDRKMVMEPVEDYLENCDHVMVDIDIPESLLKPEKLEVCLRYVLKYSTRRGSYIFQLFDTSEKPNNSVASGRRWLESQGKMVHGKRVGRTSGMLFEHQGAMAEGPPCPERTLKTPLPQQSSSSDKEEEGLAFENLAKEMLRYLDNSEDVKVGVTELQERLEVPEKKVFLFGKWLSRR